MARSSNPYLLGDRVRARRERSGYSLRALARRAGVAPETVRAVELGASSPTIATAEKIARGLGTELRDLVIPGTETATIRRRGPKKNVMLRAKRSGIIREPDGTRFKVTAGKDYLAVDHPVFKSNPELRRDFEPVDVVAEMRSASQRREERALYGERPSGGRFQIPKRTPPRFQIP